MILTAQEFINSGLPTSSDLATEEIEFSIRTVEHTIVKPRLSAELYADIADNPNNYTEAINGSNTVGGLLLAENNLVFAYMIYNKTRLTRFTTVVKDDERSSEPSLNDLLAIAKGYWETGFMLLEEVCKFLQAPEPKHPLNNLVFGELLTTL